jgi:hypothetical protein
MSEFRKLLPVHESWCASMNSECDCGAISAEAIIKAHAVAPSVGTQEPGEPLDCGMPELEKALYADFARSYPTKAHQLTGIALEAIARLRAALAPTGERPAQTPDRLSEICGQTSDKEVFQPWIGPKPTVAITNMEAWFIEQIEWFSVHDKDREAHKCLTVGLELLRAQEGKA